MPKTMTELWIEYINEKNPVTKWALRECVRDRIELNNMYIATFYMYNLSRED